MTARYKIYIICYIDEHPVDFLLPVYTETEFANVTEVAGDCFKTGSPHNVEIMLACREDGALNLLRLNIDHACKANANISFAIVVNEQTETVSLRVFSDEQHNSFFPLPEDFVRHARRQ